MFLKILLQVIWKQRVQRVVSSARGPLIQKEQSLEHNIITRTLQMKNYKFCTTSTTCSSWLLKIFYRSQQFLQFTFMCKVLKIWKSKQYIQDFISPWRCGLASLTNSSLSQIIQAILEKQKFICSYLHKMTPTQQTLYSGLVLTCTFCLMVLQNFCH